MCVWGGGGGGRGAGVCPRRLGFTDRAFFLLTSVQSFGRSVVSPSGRPHALTSTTTSRNLLWNIKLRTGEGGGGGLSVKDGKGWVERGGGGGGQSMTDSLGFESVPARKTAAIVFSAIVGPNRVSTERVATTERTSQVCK